jgi:hypothetical protein
LEIAGDALGQLRKLDAVLFGKIPDGDLVVASQRSRPRLCDARSSTRL